jgi:uncharacterized protein (DUF58 family)
VPAGLSRSLDGRIDKVPHGTITFDSLREYVVGDELRRVHWRSSAKVGQLMVREQLDTSEPTIVVLLDDRGRASGRRTDAESFESACEAAASIVGRACGGPAGAAAPGVRPGDRPVPGRSDRGDPRPGDLTQQLRRCGRSGSATRWSS